MDNIAITLTLTTDDVATAAKEVGVPYEAALAYVKENQRTYQEAYIDLLLVKDLASDFENYCTGGFDEEDE